MGSETVMFHSGSGSSGGSNTSSRLIPGRRRTACANGSYIGQSTVISGQSRSSARGKR